MSKAKAGETALDALRGNADVDDSILGFHAQQTVDKALKAVLAARAIEFPWTHDLRYIIELLEQHGPSPPDPVKKAASLTPWATEFRYGESPDAALDRAAVARTVETVLKWAQSAVVRD